jgi:hypothetical protein
MAYDRHGLDLNHYLNLTDMLDAVLHRHLVFNELSDYETRFRLLRMLWEPYGLKRLALEILPKKLRALADRIVNKGGVEYREEFNRVLDARLEDNGKEFWLALWRGDPIPEDGPVVDAVG